MMGEFIKVWVVRLISLPFGISLPHSDCILSSGNPNREGRTTIIGKAAGQIFLKM
jgi:hypothetical protein